MENQVRENNYRENNNNVKTERMVETEKVMTNDEKIVKGVEAGIKKGACDKKVAIAIGLGAVGAALGTWLTIKAVKWYKNRNKAEVEEAEAEEIKDDKK